MPHDTKKQRRAAEHTARQRAAEARFAQQRAEQRRRTFVVGAAVVAVLAVIAVIAVVAVVGGGGKAKTSKGTPAPAGVVSAVTSIPVATTNAIGVGSATSLPKSLSGAPLTAGGHPEVLYVGGEFCPFCAGERWALVQALSRFGTFSGLTVIRSSEDNIGTFAFPTGSDFTSSTVEFVPKEIEDNGRKPLDKLTSAEEQIFLKGTGGQGSFPYVNIAGKWEIPAGQVDPNLLKDKSPEAIAEALANPNDPITKAIVGAANTITAALCSATGDLPANVCTPQITSLRGKFGA